MKYKGINDRLPNVNRTPLKVKGPTYSIPDFWATNENPQMAAVRNNKKLYFRFRMLQLLKVVVVLDSKIQTKQIVFFIVVV